MPPITQPIFQSENGRNFQIGVPLLFVVRVRVRDPQGGQVISEGSWEELFSPVSGDRTKLEVVESSWLCDDSSRGYLVTFFSH